MIIFLLMALGFEPRDPPRWAQEAYAGESGYVSEREFEKPIKYNRTKYRTRYYNDDWKKSVFEPQD